MTKSNRIDTDSIIADVIRRRDERKKFLQNLQKLVNKTIKKRGKMVKEKNSKLTVKPKESLSRVTLEFEEYLLKGQGDVQKSKKIGSVIVYKKQGVQNVQSSFTGYSYRVEQDAEKIVKIIRITSATDFVLFNIA